ncbi:peptide deformylase [Nonomuraea jiangxiensis]|uniref:Peptide deformylase-like n=1 Tax=Nonomuraea jiangxiensis TaxID=633440 RepID=A0A1G8NTT3_9ACTN|nr:peptide deformylase [Nonomuraea jiangxiensis]
MLRLTGRRPTPRRALPCGRDPACFSFWGASGAVGGSPVDSARYRTSPTESGNPHDPPFRAACPPRSSTTGPSPCGHSVKRPGRQESAGGEPPHGCRDPGGTSSADAERTPGEAAGGTPREVLGAPHRLLSVVAEPVDPTAPEVVVAAADLLATLRSEPSTAGLAAPQIGLSWRLIAFDARRHPRSRSWAGELVVVNPRLAAASHWDHAREGCASIAGLTADVRRATRITVHGHLPGSGEPVTIEADAFEARCIQHQLDHLDGLLFLDRVPGALSLHRRLHTCDA